MIASLKPVGREEYALTLDAQPVYSSAIFGGYEQAQLVCRLDDEQRLNARGGRLRIHGESGIVWQGIVTRRPGRGEPLIALGWGWAATLKRRAALYCDTSVSEWSERTNETRNTDMTCQTEPAALAIVLEAGKTYSGYNGFYRVIPAGTTGVLSFTWARGSLDERVHYIIDSTETEVAAYGSGGYTGTVTATITNASSLILGCNASSYAVGTSNAVRFSNIKVYGVSGVTSTTTTNVLKNVLDNEVSTTYLPAGAAYRAWIGTESTAVEPLVFDSCDASTKIAELTKYAAWDYGWYMEPVAGDTVCVPHWTARPTTPDYIVRLEQSESYDLDESAFDELVSAVRVSYQDANGRTAYTDVTDTDTTHPLVAAGITRYGDISVQTSSSSTATAIGTLYLAENGREQVKGSIVTRHVMSSTGADVYLPDIKPGKVARVMGLPDGQRDCLIKRVTMTGEDICSLELDNDPYRLDIVLAQLSKREA